MSKINLLLVLSLVIPNVLYAKVTETKLTNGLKIIIKEDHRFPVMVSQIWYKVGSSYEYGGITGISHMLEHMMFKGTKKYGINQFSKIIAANGGKDNAFTGRDYTAYFQRMASSQYPLSFELESDRMRNLQLNEKEFIKERNVVMEERIMRVDDNPRAIANERFLATAYTNSPYHHPIIGWADDIKNYQFSDLSIWYQKWYAPNNATLVVVGDVDPDKVIFEAKKWFSSLAAGDITPPKPQHEIKLLGEKNINIYSNKVKTSSLIMGYFVPSLITSQIKWEPYAIEVLAYILDGGDSSRFSKQLIRKQKIATSVGVGYDPATRLKSLFTISGTLSDKHTITQLKQALLQQISRLKTELVDRAELKRIITQLVASQTYEQDSIFYQAMQIGRLETVGLSWKVAENFVDKLKLVTPEQIQQVAKKYFKKKYLITATLLPNN